MNIMKYDFWKISTLILLLIISLFAGTVGHMQLMNFNVLKSIYALLGLSLVVCFLQLPVLIEYVIKRGERKNDGD